MGRATPGDLWTREDWNQLIRDVNEILENPDPEDSQHEDGTDCEPIEPIEEVEEEHIWMRADDIEFMQDKLKETCPDIKFEETLDLWKAEIIDEIEKAMDEAWCDCEKKCGEACDNCRPWGDRGDRNFSGTSRSQGCTEEDCTPPEATYDQWVDVSVQRGMQLDYYWIYFQQACNIQKALERLEDQLEDLEEELETLQQQESELCAKEETQSACAAKRQEIADKEAEIEEKEQEIDEKEQELEEKEAERDEALSQAESLNAQAEALGLAYNSACGTPRYSMKANGSEPWTNMDCEDMPNCSCWSPDPIAWACPGECVATWAMSGRWTVWYSGDLAEWECDSWWYLYWIKMCGHWTANCVEDPNGESENPNDDFFPANVRGSYMPDGATTWLPQSSYYSGYYCWSNNCGGITCGCDTAWIEYEYYTGVSFPTCGRHGGKEKCDGGGPCEEEEGGEGGEGGGGET